MQELIVVFLDESDFESQGKSVVLTFFEILPMRDRRAKWSNKNILEFIL